MPPVWPLLLNFILCGSPPVNLSQTSDSTSLSQDLAFLNVLEPSDTAPSDPQISSVSVRGVVRNSVTQTPVATAVVTVEEPLIQVHVDDTGTFRLPPLPPGTLTLLVAAEGFKFHKQEITLIQGEAHSVEIELEPEGETTDGDRVSSDPDADYEDTIVVTAERQDIAPARRTLEREEVRVLPGAWGDPFRAAQNLPGVARSFLGFFGELAVRGSAPEDTRLYVDGHEVPLLYHFGGLKSLINPKSLDRVEFLPGGFGAYYGRATGGILDARTRDDIPDQTRFHLQTDLLDTAIFTQTPIANGAVSAALRRSYIDLLIRPFDVTAALPRYYDYQLKGDVVLDNGDTLSGLLFGTDDAVVSTLGSEDEGEDAIRTIFNRLQGKWRRNLGNGRTVQVSASLGTEKGLAASNLTLKPTWQGGARVDYRARLSHKFFLNTGLDLVTKYQDTSGGLFEGEGTEPEDSGEKPTNEDNEEYPFEVGRPRNFLNNAGTYLEMEWKPTRRFTLVPGLRAEWFDAINTATLDPRLAMRYRLRDQTTLLAAGGVYQQPPRIGLLGIFVFDLSAFGVAMPPERAIHSVMGVEQTLGPMLGLEAYAYYKHMDHLVEISALDFGDGSQQEDLFLVDGTGRSYGLEMMLRLYPTEQLFAWIAYSLSKSERKSLSTGDWFPFGYDQTHNLNIVASYQITPTIRIGGRFRYVSGNPFTPMEGSIYDVDSGGYIGIPGELLSARMPNFGQLDLRIDKVIQKRIWRFVLFADVMNVTNRKNPEFPAYNFDYTKISYIPGLPILPMIGFEAMR